MADDTQSVPMARVTLRRKLLDKIDHRPRDLPAGVRASLKRAVSAVLSAYEEDKEELGLQEPSTESLKGLLRFVAHPHRDDWMLPALALGPEGRFVAIWDVKSNRYSVEFLSAASADWIGILRTADHVERLNGHYENFDIYQRPPFSIPRRSAAP
jgi:hypothetical protein